jgi:uncharacterized membrane protein
MKKSLVFVARSVLGGLLVLVPVYLAILVLLKGMKTVAVLVRPFTFLLPDWFPAEKALSLVLVLLICFLIGAGVLTRAGRRARERVERGFFQRIPGYTLFRSLTQQVTGDKHQSIWKPALVQMGQSFVTAFIIEEFEDGRYTIFVPSIPTPISGSVHILDRKWVHPLDVPLSQALKAISRWGSGTKDLVAAMENDASSQGHNEGAPIAVSGQ